MSDMICTCGPEGLMEAENLRVSVARRMGVAPEKFGMAVFDSIQKDFGAKIDTAADMWFGVSAAVPGGWSGYKECDLPLDGYAWLWSQLAEQYPDKVPAAGDGFPDGQEDRSRAEVAEYAQQRRAYDDHKHECKTCDVPKGEYKWGSCPTQKALFEEYCEAHQNIDGKWGLPDYDEVRVWWDSYPEPTPEAEE